MVIFESDKIDTDDMFYGLNILYNDSEVKESFDPILSIAKNNNILSINNGFNIYEVHLERVKDLILYERHAEDGILIDKNHDKLNINQDL